MTTRALLLALLLSAAPLFAGPFGLEMGMKQELFPILVPTAVPGSYLVMKVPAPNPTFPSYLLSFSANAGLYRVTASTMAIHTDATGAELRAEHDRLQALLKKKYGPTHTFDVVQKGAKLTTPEKWMLALKGKERAYSSSWVSGKTVLPDDIAAILLECVAEDGVTGRVKLTYWFNNTADGEKENQAAALRGL